MQLTIELPEKTVRKMRALAVLQENDNSDFMAMVADYIDKAVSTSIARELDLEPVEAPISNRLDYRSRATTSAHEIAEGLSYEIVEHDEPEETPKLAKAHAIGLRLDDLDKLNDVGELGGSISPDETEMTFAEAFGLREDLMTASPSSADDNPFRDPAPNPVTPIPRSTRAKKLPKNVKARVSNYEGNEESSF